MLKRNKVLVAFMLVAVLCMSIGFAAISDTLTANGDMALDFSEGGLLDTEFDKNVVFVEPMNVTSKVTKSEVSTDGDTYTFTIDKSAFTKATDYVELTVKIQNNNTADATVTINSDLDEGALDNYITVNTNIDSANTATVLKDGGKVTLNIKVTLDSIPQTTETSTIKFTIDAKPAA